MLTPDTNGADDAPPFDITISDGFEQWLHESGASLVFTIPPAKLFFAGLDDDGHIAIFERSFNKCMGIAHVGSQTLHVSTRYNVWRMENVLSAGERTDQGHDRLYVPMKSSTTGYLNTHDLGVDADGRTLLINTRFGSLVATSDTHNFETLWWPPFLPGPWPNDRCHINGLAMRDGRPTHVTCVGEASDVDGWRRHRRDGGIVVDIDANEIVARGMSMPHSPRWHDGRLWVANAGTGELGTIDLARGVFEPVVHLPGFVRGLTFVGRYAVVGSSKPRRGDIYSGLALDDLLAASGEAPRLGFFVVDTHTAEVVAWLFIEDPELREVFEVMALPGVRRPAAVGLLSPEIASNVWPDVREGVLR